MYSVNLINHEDNEDQEKLEIHNTNNVVYVKAKLADKIGERVQDIKLFYKKDDNDKTIIDDNCFLPNDIYVFYYEINDNLNDIIIRVKRNYCGVPKFLQFSKNTQISEFIEKLKVLFNITTSFRLFKSDGSILETSSTFDENKLMDNSKIKLWQGESLNVTIILSNPLEIEDENRNQCFGKIEVSVTEKVSHLKEQILKIRNFVNLQIFTDTAFLNDDDQLLIYPIKNETILYCVDMDKKFHVEIKDKITNGKYAEISYGKIKEAFHDEECVVYKYNRDVMTLSSMKILKYEIVTRLKLSYGDGYPFVRLLTMYTEEKKIFIVMEHMARGSLRSRLTERLSEEDIKRYYNHILNGLNFMHKMKIIHRSMNCGSVLIDGNNNAKLCNFHFSKFLYNATSDMLLTGIKGSKVEDEICWAAPEVLCGEPYGFKADIWSFGATLIEMITRKRPYPNINTVQAFRKISKDRTIVYEHNIYPNTSFDVIIGKCIQGKQSARPMAYDLLND